MRSLSGASAALLAHTLGEVQPSGNWYHNFEYAVEQQRGLDYQEIFSTLWC